MPRKTASSERKGKSTAVAETKSSAKSQAATLMKNSKAAKKAEGTVGKTRRSAGSAMMKNSKEGTVGKTRRSAGAAAEPAPRLRTYYIGKNRGVYTLSRAAGGGQRKIYHRLEDVPVHATLKDRSGGGSGKRPAVAAPRRIARAAGGKRAAPTPPLVAPRRVARAAGAERSPPIRVRHVHVHVAAPPRLRRPVERVGGGRKLRVVRMVEPAQRAGGGYESDERYERYEPREGGVLYRGPYGYPYGYGYYPGGALGAIATAPLWLGDDDSNNAAAAASADD